MSPNYTEGKILPSDEACERAKQFLTNNTWIFDFHIEQDISYDELGGISLELFPNNNYKLQNWNVWFSFMNNGSDTIILSDNKKIDSFKLNEFGISIIRNFLTNNK